MWHFGLSVIRGARRGLILPLLASVFLGGCSTYSWYKSGATQQEWARDNSDCQLASARAFPAVRENIVLKQGYRTNEITNCSGGSSGSISPTYIGGGATLNTSGTVNCVTNPSQYVPPVVYVTDINEEARGDAFNNCMNGRGWQLRRDKPAAEKPSDRSVANFTSGNTVASGASCKTQFECGSGLYCLNSSCTPFAGTSSAAGRSTQSEGGACKTQFECGSGLFCSNAVCTPFAK